MSSAYSSVRSSPIPDLAYDSYRSLALRDQALLKRQLSSNLESTPPGSHHPNLHYRGQHHDDTDSQQQQVHGHQQHHGSTRINPMLQHHLMKMSKNPYDYVTCQGATYTLSPYSGETLLFWILLAVLIILVVVNLTLTLVIFGTLRLGIGMESLEAFPSFMKFFGNTDLDEIFKPDGIIESFANQPMSIETDDEHGQINLWTHGGYQPSLTMDKNGLNISQVNEIKLVNEHGEQLFTTTNPTLNIPHGIKNLDVKMVKVNKISSDINSTLDLISTRHTTMKGSEGTKMEGKEIHWIADHDILLKSNEKITLSGKEGIQIYRYSLPLVDKHGVTRNFYTLQTHGKKQSQFKLCICMPEGKLFRIEIPLGNNQNTKHGGGSGAARKIGCHSAFNPC